MIGFGEQPVKGTQIGRHGFAQNFPCGRKWSLRYGVGAGCGAKSQMNSLIIGVVVAPIGSQRATSDWDRNRRATLTNGFVLNTIGRPAYSFPSDSPSNLHGRLPRAKHECFLRHGSSPERGWSANKLLRPTPGSALSSAARFTSLGPAWPSSER
jgi:hypothetical protein